MSANTKPRPAPVGTNAGAGVENHWIKSSAITASIVTGVPATALCGVLVPVASQGDGNVAAQGADICPLCGILYAGLLQ